jgi:hypothetical protein
LTVQQTNGSLLWWSDDGQFVAGSSYGTPAVGERGDVLAQEGKRQIQKMKNSGNEAKKYLKTKENRFFSDANCTHFARK